jgi:membrane-bound lytic murein transglycosylase F
VANIRRYYDILTWATQPQLEGDQAADGKLHIPGINKTKPKEEPQL